MDTVEPKKQAEISIKLPTHIQEMYGWVKKFSLKKNPAKIAKHQNTPLFF